MNVPVIREWIAALRSGKYRQGRHFGMYSCLDVLFEIVKERCDIDPKTRKDDKTSLLKICNFVDPDNELNTSVGFRPTYWNDREKLTFPQIADRIESFLPEPVDHKAEEQSDDFNQAVRS